MEKPVDGAYRKRAVIIQYIGQQGFGHRRDIAFILTCIFFHIGEITGFLRIRRQNIQLLQDSALHFVCRLVSKRNRQNMTISIRVTALQQKPDIFFGQCKCFPRTCGGLQYFYLFSHYRPQIFLKSQYLHVSRSSALRKSISGETSSAKIPPSFSSTKSLNSALLIPDIIPELNSFWTG